MSASTRPIRTSSMRRMAAAAKLHRGSRLRRRGQRHLQVDRWRHDLEAADRGVAEHHPGEHRDRTEQLTVLYAAAAGSAPNAGGRGANPTTGVVGFYKSTDGGEHWKPA